MKWERIIWIGLSILLILHVTNSKKVTIHNDQLRIDTAGNVVDCHSGNIVKSGNTYFMYGERYGNYTGINDKTWPQLHVYTSSDLVSWVHEGPMLIDAPNGTYFTPFVVYNSKTNMFVAWFNAYPNGCCSGSFGVAKSSNGINFAIVTLTEVPKYPLVDCNALFVDDDGTAYVIYSSLQADHKVSIEKLTSDYLHTTLQNYGLFPDRYVEGPILFKRNGIYYASYGSCCCFCRAGSGVVVFRSKNIQGPWSRISTDRNCNTTSEIICGKYGDRDTSSNLIINAQGIGFSLIPTKEGMVYLWQSERWLSAPHNNPECPDECRPPTGPCKEPSDYIKGDGYSYWYPLEFDENDDVQVFSSFVDSFTLDLLD